MISPSQNLLKLVLVTLVTAFCALNAVMIVWWLLGVVIQTGVESQSSVVADYDRSLHREPHQLLRPIIASPPPAEGWLVEKVCMIDSTQVFSKLGVRHTYELRTVFIEYSVTSEAAKARLAESLALGHQPELNLDELTGVTTRAPDNFPPSPPWWPQRLRLALVENLLVFANPEDLDRIFERSSSWKRK